jgi:hypothetical protein
MASHFFFMIPINLLKQHRPLFLLSTLLTFAICPAQEITALKATVSPSTGGGSVFLIGMAISLLLFIFSEFGHSPVLLQSEYILLSKYKAEILGTFKQNQICTAEQAFITSASST